VCGETKERKAIFQEKPFQIGRQSLERTPKLDIHTEMNLLEKKLDELRAMNVDEKTLKYALKDYGIERFIKLLPYFSFNFLLYTVIMYRSNIIYDLI